MTVLFNLWLVIVFVIFFFFFNDTATTEIYTLSLHDALPISATAARPRRGCRSGTRPRRPPGAPRGPGLAGADRPGSAHCPTTRRGTPRRTRPRHPRCPPRSRAERRR